MDIEVVAFAATSLANALAIYWTTRRTGPDQRDEEEADRLKVRSAAMRLLARRRTAESETAAGGTGLVYMADAKMALILDRTLTPAHGPSAHADQVLLHALAQREHEVRLQLSEIPDDRDVMLLDAPLENRDMAAALNIVQLPEQAGTQDSELLDLVQNPDTAPAISNLYTSLNGIFEKLGPPPERLAGAEPASKGSGGGSE